VAEEFPSAISLAAGRPAERLYERLNPEWLRDAQACYERYAGRAGSTPNLRPCLLQYGRTAGIISELVAQQLKTDEQVPADSSEILITAGCQEALALCLPALCPDPEDVVLVPNPTYAGATGAAWANGIHTFPIANAHGDIVANIEQAVRNLQRSGRRPRAIYLIPNFDNPTGGVIEEPQRREILSLCAQLRVVVIEDSAYGMFRYEGPAIRPMFALDEAGCVIYVSTFSKTIAPSVRVGAATLPKTLFGDRAASKALWNDLVQRKSCMTGHTSQITQAIVGGILLDQNCSLQGWIQPALAQYKENRDAMLSELESVFSSMSELVRWNHPHGGFFLTLEFPFQFDRESSVECATQYGVIVMPMSFFASDNSQDRCTRLAFSAVDPLQIAPAIRSLGAYVLSHMGHEIGGAYEFANG
jgi:(S)-3,5-dihydroxyphenylglycine transaminase